MEGQACRRLWQSDHELSRSMEDQIQTPCSHRIEEAKTGEWSGDPNEML